MRSFDAWLFARLSSGQPCDDLIKAIHPRFRALAEFLAGIEPSVRPIAVGGYLASQRDRDAIYKAVADADPLGPAPPSSANLRPACALDLDQAAAGVQWAWPGWIPRGRVSGVGGFEGTGKTRFALDLARRVPQSAVARWSTHDFAARLSVVVDLRRRPSRRNRRRRAENEHSFGCDPVQRIAREPVRRRGFGRPRCH